MAKSDAMMDRCFECAEAMKGVRSPAKFMDLIRATAKAFDDRDDNEVICCFGAARQLLNDPEEV